MSVACVAQEGAACMMVEWNIRDAERCMADKSPVLHF